MEIIIHSFPPNSYKVKLKKFEFKAPFERSWILSSCSFAHSFNKHTFSTYPVPREIV